VLYIIRLKQLVCSSYLEKIKRAPFLYKLLCKVVQNIFAVYDITFRVKHSRSKMCSGHGRLCVCLSVPSRNSTLLHGPGYNLGNGRGAL